MRTLILSLTVSFIFVLACIESADVPTQTPYPTYTPQATFTPYPVPTPEVVVKEVTVEKIVEVAVTATPISMPSDSAITWRDCDLFFFQWI
jgi:hypothetical protein